MGCIDYLSYIISGYLFELIRGSFEVFQTEAIPLKSTQEKEIFLFSFYEHKRKPIDAIVKITAISISGKKSKPQLLRIKHDGEKLIMASVKKRPHTDCKQGNNFFSQQMACR